jgi:hypothetical protein
VQPPELLVGRLLPLERRPSDCLPVLGVGLRLDHVARGLARLREQDQGRGVGSLKREGEVEEDERVRIPAQRRGRAVHGHPGDDDDRLADQVTRRAEEARSLLGRPAEGVVPERGVQANVRVVGAGLSRHRRSFLLYP